MRISLAYIRWIVAVTVVGIAASSSVAQQQTPVGAPQSPAGARQGGPGRTGGPNTFQRPPALPFPDAAKELETMGPKIRVVPYLKGLANPWSLTFLPNGDMLITERPGRLRIARNGTLDPEPIAGVPEVWAVGQGGLLEVLPHSRFAENQWLYLTYSKPCPAEKSATTALARGKFDGKTLTDVRDLFVADNCNTGNPHFGSKLAWGRDGMLYMTVGERGDRNRAQNTAIHGGKVLRLKDDGTVPPDNPFVGKEGYKPEIYTYGHRNPQGIGWDSTGKLWEAEFGNSFVDEVNLLIAGNNYGWPTCEGSCSVAGMTNPKWQKGVASCSCSGFAVVNDTIYLGALRGQRLWRLEITGSSITNESQYFTTFGRIRSVTKVPGDAAIWFGTSNEDNNGNGTPDVIRQSLIR
jgi:aldose sugar dehydrogenase